VSRSPTPPGPAASTPAEAPARPRGPRPTPPPREVRFIGSFPDAPPPATLPEVAFAGRSNVGKSSAINAVLDRPRAARVSKTPGRTQALNLFEVDHAQAAFTLVDLPGYGFARVPDAVQDRWKVAIEAYLGDRPALRLVISLVDARLPAQDLDRQLLAGLQRAGVPHLVVATKIDKLPRSKQKAAVAALARGLEVPEVLPISSETGEGIEALRARIITAVRAPLG